MKIAIGNDQHGFAYKNMLVSLFPEHTFVDMGSHDVQPVSYPLIAEAVAKKVASGACERGILICGTGIGMAMAANKVKGAYAAVCHDLYSTERSILSNDGNILCMGALVIGAKTAETLVAHWLPLRFDPTSPSAEKVAELRHLEEVKA
ncbi:MAG: RpiB/LacA/LacB family sugar-phosphate isomerase [Clostridia bacterium]|nr:RpiB/LacA/LacB family sugar-phosphate isomerase [Clostridia bacterium]